MRRFEFKNIFIAFFLILLFSSCRNPPRAITQPPVISDTGSVNFPFFLSSKTMIINTEQSNEMEGHYLKVLEVVNDSTLRINFPDNFYLNNSNCTNWMFGWPTGNAWYDAGNENLRAIKALDLSKKLLTAGQLLRGTGFPLKGMRVAFWNRAPSGFKNSEKAMVVKPEWWKGFAGKSMEFGAIVFDSIQKHWVMYLQEVDTNHVNIYAAVSYDLKNWAAYHNGKTLFNPKDFERTNWAGFSESPETRQTARLYSAIFKDGKWYFFLSGYNKQGQRSIGLITSPNPLEGPFEIHPEALIAPSNGKCDALGCFYPKICKVKNRFLMYYDGQAADGTETVCLAESDDLLTWKKYDKNPVIDSHYGWRSGRFTSEPNYVAFQNDTVYLMAGGYKKYNTEFTPDDSIKHKLPLDTAIFSAGESDKGKYISGNVMDAQLGVFFSTDGGYTFKAHANNPVWLNDYADTLQNDHLGGDFFYYRNEDSSYIIYQAKSEQLKRYNILMRLK
jgi:hypothetical protein